MKYTRNQVKSLTNPSAAIPRVPLLPLKKKKIRHHYLYIYRRYIREACQKNSSPSGDDTFADSAGIGNGRGSRHIIRDFSPSLEKSRDLPAALHRRQAKFRPPRSSHPSITRRLFARADRSMMYGMIRFLPRALNNSPEGAVPPFFLSFLPRTYRCTSRNFGRN